MDEAQKRRAKRKKFPLPNIRMKFENEIAVLKACVEFSKYGSKPVTYKDLKIPGIHLKNIPSELVFLNSINLLNKGGKRGEYIPTPEAISFVISLNEGKVEEAKRILANVLRTSWFGELVLKSLKIKEEITLDDLTKLLGGEAHIDSKSDVSAIKRLFEWLEYAEIVELESDKIKLKADKIPDKVQVVEQERIEKFEEQEKVGKTSEITINLSFLIDPKAADEKDLKEIAKKIKDLIQEIKKELKNEKF